MAKITLPAESTPASPAANFLELFYSSSFSPPAPAVIDENGNICRIGGLTTQDYRLIKVTHLVAGTTTYTPPAGTRALFVECWGAGGGGGGVATAATNAGAGGGGGGGAYAAKWVTTLIAGAHNITIGAGGAGGTAGANTGSLGGHTDFFDTAAALVVLARGGSGGLGDTIATIHAGGKGGAGGDAATSTGDVKIDGAVGETGIALAAAQAISGNGAPGFEGVGGALGVKAQGAGAAALSTSYGSGGSGGCALSGGASVAGGAGAAGIMRIWEYA